MQVYDSPARREPDQPRRNRNTPAPSRQRGLERLMMQMAAKPPMRRPSRSESGSPPPYDETDIRRGAKAARRGLTDLLPGIFPSRLDRHAARAQGFLEKYGPQVADLLNLEQVPVEFGYSNNYPDPGDQYPDFTPIAWASPGKVTFNQEFLRRAGPRAIRSTAIHELAHAYGAGRENPNAWMHEGLAELASNLIDPLNARNPWDPMQWRYPLGLVKRSLLDLIGGV